MTFVWRRDTVTGDAFPEKRRRQLPFRGKNHRENKSDLVAWLIGIHGRMTS
jgi:hypothetical protein